MSPRLLLLLALSLFTLKAEAAPIPDFNGTGVTRWNISPTSPNVTYFIDPTAVELPLKNRTV